MYTSEDFIHTLKHDVAIEKCFNKPDIEVLPYLGLAWLTLRLALASLEQVCALYRLANLGISRLVLASAWDSHSPAFAF